MWFIVRNIFQSFYLKISQTFGSIFHCFASITTLTRILYHIKSYKLWVVLYNCPIFQRLVGHFVNMSSNTSSFFTVKHLCLLLPFAVQGRCSAGLCSPVQRVVMRAPPTTLCPGVRGERGSRHPGPTSLGSSGALPRPACEYE